MTADDRPTKVDLLVAIVATEIIMIGGLAVFYVVVESTRDTWGMGPAGLFGALVTGVAVILGYLLFARLVRRFKSANGAGAA